MVYNKYITGIITKLMCGMKNGSVFGHLVIFNTAFLLPGTITAWPETKKTYL